MKINNRKGVALLIALSIVIILVILASAMLMLVRGHYGTTSNQIKHAKDYYLAEAGVQYAIARLKAGIWSAPWTYSISVEHTNDVQIQLEVNADNGGVIIHSTSNY